MNSPVHPIFDRVLQALGPDYERDEQGRIGYVPIPFDPWDDDLMHDVCGKKLAPPIQQLLIGLRQIEANRGDDKETVDFLLPMLRQLYEACKEEWRNR